MILLESRGVKFRVQYPNAPGHEVELEGAIAILGRDPSCDLVLNDVKCSRRHAVVEASAQGLAIRDTGSANGVFLNGKKVDRGALKEGDVVRLGDILLTVLPEDTRGTLVMGPDELPAATALDVPKPQPDVPKPPPPPQRKTETVPPRPRPIIPPRVERETHRPLTLTVLALLWMISVLLYPAAAVAGVRGARGGGAALMVAAGVVLGLLSAVMAFGLWTRRSWARVAQIAIGALGLLVCPFTLASAAVIAYMLRPATRAYFSGAPGAAAELKPDAAELTFTGLLMATVLLGVVVAAALGFVALPSLSGLPR